ncbi:hypothetical protein PRN20_17335 [Devosia sp. ZB163]|uniref:hypothetical protein n=1 Tax=Devosia sp. ZB163 TaxID=3025938 RepID=UPI00235E864D|nr:hypothetical protein [Devosia sp. ZB163]MDC9825498.1 hypothetical protein [Devosia sp. ZB163]
MTRSLISALALTGAMLFAGPAFAQTVVGGATVSAEDLPKVQAACDTLAAKEQVDTGVTADTQASTETSTDASAGDTDAGMDAATTTSIDLALLTYQSCKDAGLVQ